MCKGTANDKIFQVFGGLGRFVCILWQESETAHSCVEFYMNPAFYAVLFRYAVLKNPVFIRSESGSYAV